MLLDYIIKRYFKFLPVILITLLLILTSNYIFKINSLGISPYGIIEKYNNEKIEDIAFFNEEYGDKKIIVCCFVTNNNNYNLCIVEKKMLFYQLVYSSGGINPSLPYVMSELSFERGSDIRYFIRYGTNFLENYDKKIEIFFHAKRG